MGKQQQKRARLVVWLEAFLSTSCRGVASCIVTDTDGDEWDLSAIA